MNHGSAYRYRKLCSRWVPRQLSDDHKRARQTICQEQMDRHAREGDAFLHLIVTEDEPSVYHHEPESKRQSMQRKHPSSPANKKFKTQASAGKVMLTILWDVSVPILAHFQEKGQIVTSARYSDKPVNEMEVRDTMETPGTSLKKSTVASRQRPPPCGCAYGGYTTCSEI